MNVPTSLHTAHQLDQLAAQFEHWRQTRSRPSERIPQALWQQAAALARVLPYSRVAKHLRLSPNDLKTHTRAHQDLPPTQTPALSFVEVSPLGQLPVSNSPTELELRRADGARLCLRSAHSTLSLPALVRAFLEAH